MSRHGVVRLRGLVAIVLGIQLAGSTAVATLVVFSNFGVGDTFDSGNTWAVLGANHSTPQEVAAPFSPNMSATLIGGDFAVQHTAGDTQLTARIYSDVSSKPGSILDSSTLPSFATGVVSFAFTGGVPLAAGQNYWAGLSTSPSGESGWYFSDPLQIDLLATSDNQGSNWLTFGSTDPQPAFRIKAVPEPSQAMLPAAIGLVCLALRRFRKRARCVA